MPYTTWFLSDQLQSRKASSRGHLFVYNGMRHCVCSLCLCIITFWVISQICSFKILKFPYFERGTRFCWAWRQYWCKPYLNFFYCFLIFFANIFLFEANKRICFCFEEFPIFTYITFFYFQIFGRDWRLESQHF